MTKFAASGAVLALAAFAHADTVYNDSTGELFDNGVSNLDISSVQVSNDANNIYFSVSTVGSADWTKYMIFLNTGGAGSSSNAWNRPVNLNGQTIDYFVGSWTNEGSNNTQLVGWDGANWNWGGVQTSTNSGPNFKVTWSFSLASLGLSVGDSLLFDVGTSGGGDGDTTVDLLSRSSMATDWWTNPATAGEYLKYQIIPGPGGVAFLGLAGLLIGRRRRA